MKKTALLLIFALTYVIGKGQNLVPNGDFEQYSGCPSFWGDLDSALFWLNPSINYSASPDYYHQCSSFPSINVPYNWGGNNFQLPHSGNAYAGIYLTLFFPTQNNREYLEAQLTSPLVANMCYHFEMYVNLVALSQVTTDDIGIYFSDTAITGITDNLPLPLIPQLINQAGNYPDTLNWILVEGDYTATGGENYLIIGNFKDDANTNTMLANSNGSSPSAYCFIDDVCFTPCDSSCTNITGIEEQNSNDDVLKIYPNPAAEFVTINSTLHAGDEIRLTDLPGKILFNTTITEPTSSYKIKTSHLSSGIYFIRAGKKVRRFVKK